MDGQRERFPQDERPEEGRRTLPIGGLPVVAVTRADLAEMLVADRRARRGTKLPPRFLTSANGHVLALCGRDPALRAAVTSADVIDADGMSLVIASRWLADAPLPERIATTDFFHDAARVGEREGMSFFLLGATPEANAAALERVRAAYPGLRTEGRHGYFDPGEEAAVIEEIRRAKPDVVWVGLGVPREQAFALRLREALAEDGVTWIKTCGGLFDFLSGRNARAPRFVQDIGFEWLWRTALEPRRLFKRYAVTNLQAIRLMAKHARRTRAAGRIASRVARPGTDEAA